jgi:hypothetical protein
MALDTKLSDLAVTVQADALAGLLDNGFVDVMTGPKPDSANEPVTTQTVLVTLSFGKPAFLKSVGGVIAANAIAPGVAMGRGDATWFRAYRADHTTPVFDGSAGKGKGFNMELPAKTIVEGVTVGCSGLTHTVTKSMPGI